MFGYYCFKLLINFREPWDCHYHWMKFWITRDWCLGVCLCLMIHWVLTLIQSHWVLLKFYFFVKEDIKETISPSFLRLKCSILFQLILSKPCLAISALNFKLTLVNLGIVIITEWNSGLQEIVVLEYVSVLWLIGYWLLFSLIEFFSNFISLWRKISKKRFLHLF